MPVAEENTTTSPEEEARNYLRRSLPAGGWRAASLALGRNHAYLEQYIRTGRPAWLAESDREFLVEFYALDGDRLRPPPLTGKPRPPDTNGVKQRVPIDAAMLRVINENQRAAQIVLALQRVKNPADLELILNMVLALADRGITA